MSTDTTRIIVGIDGSEDSVKALREAAEFARALGRPLHAISAWSWPSFGAETAALGIEWDPQQDARTLLGDAVAAVFGDAVPAWFTSETVNGPAALVLVEASASASLVVVGSRGHGGVVGLLLGSVSNALASRAKSDILIVR